MRRRAGSPTMSVAMTSAETIVVESTTTHPVSDDELAGVLRRVYVEGGFTAPDLAATLFAPDSVRARGEILIVRDPAGGELLGMVMVVLPTSPARRIAERDEAEMHLLAVVPEQRGRGIGGALVEAAMRTAKDNGQTRMVLWTQPSMDVAQRLYVKARFARAPERDWRRGDRAFLVYEAPL